MVTKLEPRKNGKGLTAKEVRAMEDQLVNAGLIIVGGFDPQTNGYNLLNLDTLRQLWILQEPQHILGVLDGRDQLSAAVAAGAAIGSQASDELVVPAGEVYYISMIEVVSPAESGPGVGDILQVNFRVSVWPDSASELGQSFWDGWQGTVALDTFLAEFHPGAPIFDPKNLPVPLRLPAGSKITLQAKLAGAVAGAQLTATLTPYGYKGKLLTT